MRKSDARLQHASNILGIGSGLLYAWFKYFAKSSDAYSRQNFLEPTFHDAHVLVVPLLVYGCGVIWHNHILPKIRAIRRNHPQRVSKTWSGLALLFILVPMIATGYLIQVSVDENWRKAWVVVHLATSAVWSLSYLIHFCFSNKTVSESSHKTLQS